MKNSLTSLCQLLSSIASIIASVYLILMIFDRMTFKKELFKLVNPFGGKYLIHFISWAAVAIILSLIVNLIKNANRER